MQYPRNATAAVPIPATIAVLEISFMMKMRENRAGKLIKKTSVCILSEFLVMSNMSDAQLM